MGHGVSGGTWWDTGHCVCLGIESRRVSGGRRWNREVVRTVLGAVSAWKIQRAGEEGAGWVQICVLQALLRTVVWGWADE